MVHESFILQLENLQLTFRNRERFDFYMPLFFFSFQNFASGHYEKALLAICAGDVEDY
jgi:annexin A10